MRKIMIMIGIVFAVIVATGSVVYAKNNQETTNQEITTTQEDTNYFQNHCYGNFDEMIQFMKDNGYDEMAQSMEEGNYLTMRDLMDNLSEEDYDRMFELMDEYGLQYNSRRGHMMGGRR